MLLCPSVGGRREITSVLVGGWWRPGGWRPEPTLTSQPQQPPHSDLSNNTSSYNNTTTAGGEDGGRLGCNLAITLLLNMDHINSTPAPVPQYFPGISKVFTIFREGRLAESAYSEIGMLVHKVNCLLMVCFYQRSLKPHNAMMNLIKLGI